MRVVLLSLPIVFCLTLVELSETNSDFVNEKHLNILKLHNNGTQKSIRFPAIMLGTKGLLIENHSASSF